MTVTVDNWEEWDRDAKVCRSNGMCVGLRQWLQHEIYWRSNLEKKVCELEAVIHNQRLEIRRLLSEKRTAETVGVAHDTEQNHSAGLSNAIPRKVQ